MPEFEELRDKLVNHIMEQVIGGVEIQFDDAVYVDSAKVAELLSGMLTEVLEEDQIKKAVKDKVRTVIMAIDEKAIAKAIQPQLEQGLFKRLFGL